MTSRLLIGGISSVATGVIAVGVGANYIDESVPKPKFSMTVPRYDESDFQGRFYQQISNCDPFTLLKTPTELQNAVDMLNEYKKAPKEALAKYSNDELWAARKLKESAVHPDTGEVIPHPFRMAGYVPFNGPVCVAMMVSGSTPALLFWNWINQSQNALVNYSNRNASSPTTNETLLKSYCGAVGAALTVAFGLSQLIKRRCSPERAAQLMRFVAFPSSMVASCSNCYIMRSPEIATGVELMDADGNVVAGGKRSSLAAKKAVHETVLSRAALQFPVFFIPAFTTSVPPLSIITNSSPAASLTVMTLVTMISFGYGLAGTVAIFPQIGTIEAKDLEEEFQSVVGSDGQKITTFSYNKGL